MPKALFCTGPDVIGWQEYELPDRLGPTQMRIRNTHGAEKQGTMAAFIHGHGNKRGHWDSTKQMFVPGGLAWSYPIPLGNMQVGQVEEAGSGIRDFRPGDRILHYGPFAPTAVAEASRAWKLAGDTSWQAATCLDPASYALCALRDGEVRLGDSVVVFSLGAIGLMAVQLARFAGCYPVIAVDPLPNRREVALQTGAHQVIDPVGADVGAMLREATGWRGVDVAIEYSGSLEALQAALRGVAFGGNVVLGGFPGPMKAGLDLGAEAHINRPNIRFTRAESDPGREHPRWDIARLRSAVHSMTLRHQLVADAIVTPVVKFDDDLVQEYHRASADPAKNIKLGVTY